MRGFVVDTGAWFNGRTSVSKTADEGSIPSAPAIKNGVDARRMLKIKGNWCVNEKNNGFYTWCPGGMVQNCLADACRCYSRNHNDSGVFGNCGAVLLCGGQYFKRACWVDFLNKIFAKGNNNGR